MHVAIDARFLNESHSGIAEYSENLLVNLSQIDQVNRYTVFIHSGFSRRLRVGKNFTIIPYPARPVSLRTLTSFSYLVRRTGCDFLHSLYPIAPVFGIRRQILTVTPSRNDHAGTTPSMVSETSLRPVRPATGVTWRFSMGSSRPVTIS